MSDVPRILIVTPEISGLPQGFGSITRYLHAKAGGLADVSGALVNSLHQAGADVHVAFPHYRRRFQDGYGPVFNRAAPPHPRIHLAEDSFFYHRDEIYHRERPNNVHAALVFQRELINNIIPRVQPDLIHCHDWMTGLIPAVARARGIKTLFTVHNIHSCETSLEEMDVSGIDGTEFWRSLYFDRLPQSYEESRSTNPVCLLSSGIMAADHVNTVSPSFLSEVVHGYHQCIPQRVRHELTCKYAVGQASGILNAPNSIYNPNTDEHLLRHFGPFNHTEGKATNKVALQNAAGLEVNPSAPLLFWPSRLDPAQKGCQLLASILHQVMADYEATGLQLVFVADGAFSTIFKDIVKIHGLEKRVAVLPFNEAQSHLAYAAADFLMMPSEFEPCGLSQMVGAIYGCLPIVRDTGGLHDTINHLNISESRGNGFVFRDYDSAGLRWAIDEALRFWELPHDIKAREIFRIMAESRDQFQLSNMGQHYLNLYETMLQRPLRKPKPVRVRPQKMPVSTLPTRFEYSFAQTK